MNNCRSKDPSTCRYHGKAFSPFITPSGHVTQIFEEVERDLAPSMVLSPVMLDNNDVFARHDYEMDSLTQEQRSALHAYTDEYGSSRIRTVLTAPDGKYDFNGESMETIHARIKILDTLIEEHSSDVRGLELWRGVKEFRYELSDLEVGSTFKNPSYTSVTDSPEVAVSFSNKNAPILLKVESGAGFRVGGQFRGEREVLLKRDSVFMVTKITENVHLEKANPRFGEDPRVRGITLVEVQEL